MYFQQFCIGFHVFYTLGVFFLEQSEQTVHNLILLLLYFFNFHSTREVLGLLQRKLLRTSNSQSKEFDRKENMCILN
jgi:hypothetical protein